MARMKDFAEQVSLDMGLDGLIDDEVMTQAATLLLSETGKMRYRGAVSKAVPDGWVSVREVHAPNGRADSIDELLDVLRAHLGMQDAAVLPMTS